MQKLKRIYVLLLSVILILSCSFTSYADLRGLMIGSNSNALMTLDLNDDDYAIMPMSSVGTVTNTINSSSIPVDIIYVDGSGKEKHTNVVAFLKNGRYEFSFTCPSGHYIDRIQPELYSVDLPSAGAYSFSFDYSSHVSYDVSKFNLYTVKYNKNAKTDSKSVQLNFIDDSGDVYVAPTNINLTNLSFMQLVISVPLSEYASSIGGSFAINFTRVASGDYPSTAGSNTSSQDYQDGVSSSLSDLSSSVDEVSDEIGFVAEAIQNLQGAMEPHYNNVLTQLHHITEQLHAFYDQIYNNIHLKEYALWQDIKTAIENIDLEVNVNLDKLKSSIDNMSQAIQNKLQSVQDTLTNGFDNSSINQDAAELDQSLQEYEEAEQTVIDQVNDSLNDFEFDSGFEEYTNTIKVFSDFIQDLYEASGGFKVVINLSLMLSIAGIVIGVYRFRDGG